MLAAVGWLKILFNKLKAADLTRSSLMTIFSSISIALFPQFSLTPFVLSPRAFCCIMALLKRSIKNNWQNNVFRLNMNLELFIWFMNFTSEHKLYLWQLSCVLELFVGRIVWRWFFRFLTCPWSQMNSETPPPSSYSPHVCLPLLRRQTLSP